jgi:hypothetical protein
MTDITSIPLNKLVASEDNVRKTAVADTALHELASSIAAHGLLQSLVVRKHRKGKFAALESLFVPRQLLPHFPSVTADEPTAARIRSGRPSTFPTSPAPAKSKSSTANAT